MAQIYNTDLSKELIQGASIQVNRDLVPNQLAEKVVPVMEVNPKLLRKCNIVRSIACTNSTTSVIYTVPADKDFYLVAASLSYVKDVTSTATSSTLTIKVDTVTSSILSLRTTTLTAENGSSTNSFPYPIKCDRGSVLSVNNSTNIANMTSVGIIVGYLVENQFQ